MKRLDRFIQAYRFRKVLPYIKKGSTILDIGCNKGEFFNFLTKKSIKFQGTGLDPHIDETVSRSNYSLLNGFFPSSHLEEKTFDQIVCMAVFEHVPTETHEKFINGIYKCLNSKGELIMTVPSARVDTLLNILGKLKLVDGMDLHEHHGFDVSSTTKLFDARFKLLRHDKFQLGLNNLFIFQSNKD